MLNNSPSTFKKELFKILLYTCGIALFLNFAVSLIREYYLGHELLEQSIRTATNILAHDLIKPLAFNDKKEAASQLKILHKQVDFLEANLYDKNGTFMISVGDSEILSTIPQAVIAQDFAIIYSYDKIEAWKSLSENNQIYGYLQIRMTRHFFSKQFLITIGTLLARAIASLLLSLLIGRTLVNKISKTLQHFVTVSKQISSQGFDKNRYTTLPNQEVQLQEFVLLSKSFDEMLRKIWAQDEFIREYNDALEKKFEERTRELTNERAKTIHSAQLAALGGMAAKIAHEINNPLTIVASVGVLLKRTMEATVIDREKVNKQLEYLDETTKRMAQIVASIRNLS